MFKHWRRVVVVWAAQINNPLLIATIFLLCGVVFKRGICCL